MKETFGIQETSEAAVFLANLVNLLSSLKKGFKDTDLIKDAIPVMVSAPNALKGASAIPKELGDLTVAEHTEVSKAFADALRLDVADEVREKALEQGIPALISLGDAIQDLISNEADGDLPA